MDYETWKFANFYRYVTEEEEGSMRYFNIILIILLIGVFLFAIRDVIRIAKDYNPKMDEPRENITIGFSGNETFSVEDKEAMKIASH